MKPKEIVQLFITVVIISAYVYLVIRGKASIEGFIGLAFYTTKKFLDIVDKNGDGK